MLAASVFLYTLGAAFFANLFGIFLAPLALRNIWQTFFVTSRRKADPLAVGDLFLKYTLSIDKSYPTHVFNPRHAASSSIIRLPSIVSSGAAADVPAWPKHDALISVDVILGEIFSGELKTASILQWAAVIMMILLYYVSVKYGQSVDPTSSTINILEPKPQTTESYHLVDPLDTASDTQDTHADKVYVQCAPAFGLDPSPSAEFPLAAPRDSANSRAETRSRVVSGPIFFTSKIVASPPPRRPTIYQQTSFKPSKADTVVDEDGWCVQRRKGKGRGRPKPQEQQARASTSRHQRQ